MEYEEIWEKTTVLLREDLPEVSYKTWIASSLKPFAMEDDHLYLEVVSDFMRKTILGRYQELINNAVLEVCHKPLTLEYLTPQERAEWQGQRKDGKDGLEISGVNHVQPQVHLRHIRRGQLQPLCARRLSGGRGRRRERPTTRCSCTAAWAWGRRT